MRSSHDHGKRVPVLSRGSPGPGTPHSALPTPHWLFLQLSDSAFPTGGFVHSGGIEAAWQLGELGDAEAHLARCLRACGRLLLPLVTAAHAAPERLPALDRRCEALTTNHVANRASRAQGQALLATAATVFGGEALIALKRRVRSEALPGHLAPVTGAVLRHLGVDGDGAARLFLFTQLRGWLSAAVRLSLVGPLEGQAIQHRLGPVLDQVLDACAGPGADDCAQTDPLLELFQAHHDRLYSRLFSS